MDERAIEMKVMGARWNPCMVSKQVGSLDSAEYLKVFYGPNTSSPVLLFSQGEIHCLNICP